jgi:hypothetical protein
MDQTQFLIQFYVQKTQKQTTSGDVGNETCEQTCVYFTRFLQITISFRKETTSVSDHNTKCSVDPCSCVAKPIVGRKWQSRGSRWGLNTRLVATTSWWRDDRVNGYHVRWWINRRLWCSGQHSCFVFWKSLIRIWTEKPTVLRVWSGVLYCTLYIAFCIYSLKPNDKLIMIYLL